MAVEHGKDKTKLTPKQSVFVQEYLVDINALQAAIRSGYSKKTAQVQASKLLSNPKVQAAINIGMGKRAEKVGFSAEATLRELQNIVHFSVKNVFDENGQLKKIHELDDATASAIASIEFATKMDGESPVHVCKLRPYDKTKAVDMAMKHFGLFEKDNEQQGNVVDAILRARGRCKK